jgi:hypothetical protein
MLKTIVSHCTLFEILSVDDDTASTTHSVFVDGGSREESRAEKSAFGCLRTETQSSSCFLTVAHCSVTMLEYLRGYSIHRDLCLDSAMTCRLP